MNKKSRLVAALCAVVFGLATAGAALAGGGHRKRRQHSDWGCARQRPTRTFDLLFLDLKLPDGPADDVYDAAKEADPELPIVVITGYPDSEMLDRILAKGPITVLKKPLKVEQLQQTVRILGHKDAAKLAA